MAGFRVLIASLWLCLGSCEREQIEQLSPQPVSAAAPVVDVVAIDPMRSAVDRERVEREARQKAEQAELERARQEAIAAHRRAEETQRQREAERVAFEAAYPLHGVTYHYLAQVFSAPSLESRVLGYMRRGAQFRAKSSVRGSGCPGGFHEVPGGGFVCNGRGYRLANEPQSFEPSAQPSLERSLPYVYGYVTEDDTPQYWHLPSDEEEREVLAAIEEFAAAEAAAAATTEAETSEAIASTSVDSGEVPPPEDGSELPDEVVEAPPPPGSAPDDGSPDSEAIEEEESPLPDYVRMRMRRGFYVSIHSEENDGRRRFYRTVRGGYVRRELVHRNDPPQMRGVVLGEGWRLPVAFVYRSGTRRLARDPNSGVLRNEGTLDLHRPMIVADEFQRGQHTYVAARDDSVVRAASVRIARPIERPSDIPADQRWIHVNLSTQTLVAYEGDTPVFATLVSTGKGEEHATPTGLWRIESKHVSTTMDDLSDAENAYSIEDVPWTMYFHGNYALHGAFWHSTFGRQRSHGCVNLAPVDARWLFQWTTPVLPQGWHGQFTRGNGSYVYITE